MPADPTPSGDPHKPREVMRPLRKSERRFQFETHALDQMARRGISEVEIREVLARTGVRGSRRQRKVHPDRDGLDTAMKRAKRSSGTSILLKLSISRRDDGTLGAAYIQFAQGGVAETRELRGNAVLGDYDSAGNLLGIEILAPIRLAELEGFVDPARRPEFRNLVGERVSDLITAGAA